MKYSSDKDIHRLIRNLVSQGWQFKRRSKHGRLISPSGAAITVSTSPGDTKTLQILRSRIRRANEN